MSMERTLSIILFLCALAISVKAQSPTQNYVLSKDVLDVDGTHAITTVQLRLEKKLLKILLNEKNFGVVCVFWVFFAHI